MTSTDLRLGLAGFFEAMNQPTNNGVNTYFISQAARKTGLTVVLSGAGAERGLLPRLDVGRARRPAR